MQKQTVSKLLMVISFRHIIDVAVFCALSVTALQIVAAHEVASADHGENLKQPLKWHQAFLSKNAAHYLEFTAHYLDRQGVQHQLHYWREGEERLRRNTDDHLDLMVEQLTNHQYRYYILDHTKKIITHISQTNLQRIGQFSSWDNLANSLTEPSGGAEVVGSSDADFSLGQNHCRWFEVRETGQSGKQQLHQNICWSKALGIPLKITSFKDGEKKTVWEVEKISVRKLNNSAFTANIAGYAIVDANQDISPESD